MITTSARFGATYADGDEHGGIILPRTKWPARQPNSTSNDASSSGSIDNRTISCIGYGGRIRPPWLPGVLQPAM